MLRNTKCVGFSYDEVENIIKRYGENYSAKYTGGILQVVNNDNRDEIIDFAVVLNKIHPELDISESALTIYLDFGYIYPRHGAEVIVIDGIQEV